MSSQDELKFGTYVYVDGNILRRSCFLKQVIEGKIKGQIEVQEDEEDDVRSCWMTLGTGEDTLI
jgi:hypothetical protein